MGRKYADYRRIFQRVGRVYDTRRDLVIKSVCFHTKPHCYEIRPHSQVGTACTVYAIARSNENVATVVPRHFQLTLIAKVDLQFTRHTFRHTVGRPKLQLNGPDCTLHR